MQAIEEVNRRNVVKGKEKMLKGTQEYEYQILLGATNRQYSYSHGWTGTSLQSRLMRGNLFKCKYFEPRLQASTTVGIRILSKHVDISAARVTLIVSNSSLFLFTL